MKFDVIRSSDYEAGRIGAQCSAPLPDCVFNKAENTWELEVPSLEGLMDVLGHVSCPVKLLHVDRTEGIPLLEILDLS